MCVCSGKHVCAVIRVHACGHRLPSSAGRQSSVLLGLSAESTKAS